MNLRQLVIRVDESHGLVRQANLRALRDYLKSQPEEGLLKEVTTLEIARHLRLLWSAGLSANLQKAVTDRLEEI